jgi:hypothetical protein
MVDGHGETRLAQPPDRVAGFRDALPGDETVDHFARERESGHGAAHERVPGRGEQQLTQHVSSLKRLFRQGHRRA